MSSTIPIPDTKSLADNYFSIINEELLSQLPWLEQAYGRAELVKRTSGNKILKAPGIYVGVSRKKNEYLELFPDSRIGNFSFFWPLEPQILSTTPYQQSKIQVPFALIFWFDLRKVYTDYVAGRDTEYLKAQILKCLMRQITLPNNAYITLGKVYETAEKIYKEFTIDQIDNQFLMSPFAGFRFEGVLYFEEPC